MEKNNIYESYHDDSPIPRCDYVCNNYRAPHFHNAIEVIYVIEGKLCARINEKEMFAEAGQILIIPSYSIHTFYSNTNVEDIVLAVPINYIPRFERLFTNKIFCENIFDPPDKEEMLCYFKKLVNIPYEPASPVLRGYVYVILGTLIENVGMNDSPNNGQKQIQKILRYIEDNYKTPITINSISKEFGLSPSRLSHIFNGLVGCSFPVYINGLRIKSAAHLIANENYSIIDASAESGFESVRTFYNSFKRVYGITPLEYKKHIDVIK